MNTVAELVDLLDLEKIEENIYRGQSHLTPWRRVFGGQVLAQAIHAAHQTVEADRVIHSMHAYFLLTGDVDHPIVYNVDRSRDGGSFTTRRVVAVQKGEPIFITSTSFQKDREGFDHQIDMPEVPGPEVLKTDAELYSYLKDEHPQFYALYVRQRPIEFRPVEEFNPLDPKSYRPFRHVWLKAKGRLPDDLRVHQEVLAYASDYNLLETALLPHRDKIDNFMFLASLDHAIWFHRPFRADEWLLYQLDSPSASNSRGFTRGNVFDRNGALVASMVQEGLMSPLRSK